MGIEKGGLDVAVSMQQLKEKIVLLNGHTCVITDILLC